MRIEEILARARGEQRNFLMEHESKELLREIGIPVTSCTVVDSKEEAVAAARAVGFPVVMKVLSPVIIHKSDVGGVMLNLTDEEAVVRAYAKIIESAREHDPNARATVQRMAPPGVEVIVGVSRDPQFGPALMFGLGGIFVELLKDVSFRLIPIDERDAEQMIREIKGYPLLEGFRGRPPADVGKIREILLKISNLVSSTPEIVELDLNPVFVYNEGALVVDARIIIN